MELKPPARGTASSSHCSTCAMLSHPLYIQPLNTMCFWDHRCGNAHSDRLIIVTHEEKRSQAVKHACELSLCKPQAEARGRHRGVAVLDADGQTLLCSGWAHPRWTGQTHFALHGKSQCGEAINSQIYIPLPPLTQPGMRPKL